MAEQTLSFYVKHVALREWLEKSQAIKNAEINSPDKFLDVMRLFVSSKGEDWDQLVASQIVSCQFFGFRTMPFAEISVRGEGERLLVLSRLFSALTA